MINFSSALNHCDLYFDIYRFNSFFSLLLSLSSNYTKLVIHPLIDERVDGAIVPVSKRPAHCTLCWGQ